MRRSLPLLAVLLMLGGTIRAAIPTTLNYQGRLRDKATGNPVPDSTGNSVIFQICTAADGSGVLWTENWHGPNYVSSTAGLFNVVLGSINPITLPFDQQYYLEIQWNNGAGYETMTPRQALTAAPYAFRARDLQLPYAATAAQGTQNLFYINNNGGGPGTVGIWGEGGSGQGVHGEGQTGTAGVVNAAGGVGVLANSASWPGALALHSLGNGIFDVSGGGPNSVTFNTHVHFNGPVTGLQGVTAPLSLSLSAALSAPLFVSNTGGGNAISATSSGTLIPGAAIYAVNTGAGANHAGIYGESNASNGSAGVIGSNSPGASIPSTAAGVYGFNNSGGAGLWGRVTGSGIGVVAEGNLLAISATASAGTGGVIYARNSSSVSTILATNDGSGAAVQGANNSGGIGVFGTSSNAQGVRGDANNANLPGVYGRSSSFNNGIGVLGEGLGAGNGGIGVIGTGVYVGVSATATAAAGQAIIGRSNSSSPTAELINDGLGSPLKLNGMKYPATDGVNGQMLATSATGQLYWASPATPVAPIGLTLNSASSAPLAVSNASGAALLINSGTVIFLGVSSSSNLVNAFNLGGGTALYGRNLGTQPTVLAEAFGDGPSIRGTYFGGLTSGAGVYGHALGGIGVYGRSNNIAGVWGDNPAGGPAVLATGNVTGLSATASNGPAVYALSSNGMGVQATGFTGTAGVTNNSAGVGVFASDNGFAAAMALSVSGKTVMSGQLQLGSSIKFPDGSIQATAPGSPAAPLSLSLSSATDAPLFVNQQGTATAVSIVASTGTALQARGQVQGIVGQASASFNGGTVVAVSATSSNSSATGQASIGLYGSAAAAGIVNKFGVYGDSSGTNSTGIYGSGATGVSGHGSSGNGVFGTSLSSINAGIMADNSSGGPALQTNGPSLFNDRLSITAAKPFGQYLLVVSQTSSVSGGSAIYGYSPASASAAVFGESSDTHSPGPAGNQGSGVFGKGPVGLIGINSIPSGFGVVANVDATGDTNSIGLFGFNGGLGTGVSGQGLTGVAGSSNGSNGSVGVLAHGQTFNDFALLSIGNSLFEGNVTVTTGNPSGAALNAYNAAGTGYALRATDVNGRGILAEGNGLGISATASNGAAIYLGGNVAADLDGPLEARGISSPSPSPGARGRIVFDSGSNRFRVSENGAAYVDMLSGGIPVPLTLTSSVPNSGAVLTVTNTGAGYGIYGGVALPGIQTSLDDTHKNSAGVYGFSPVSNSAGVLGLNTNTISNNSGGVVGIGYYNAIVGGAYGNVTNSAGGFFISSGPGAGVNAQGLTGVVGTGSGGGSIGGYFSGNTGLMAVGQGMGLSATASLSTGVAISGLNTSGAGNAPAIYGQSGSNSGFGVLGSNSPSPLTPGIGAGVAGYSTNGYGVWGRTAASTGLTPGVYGLNLGAGGAPIGVLGSTSNAPIDPSQPVGVLGFNATNSGSGVWGESNADVFAVGVTGFNDNTTLGAMAVRGRANGHGIGVEGDVLGGLAGGIGVLGAVAGNNMTGVSGVATTANSVGVAAFDIGTIGNGVQPGAALSISGTIKVNTTPVTDSSAIVVNAWVISAPVNQAPLLQVRRTTTPLNGVTSISFTWNTVSANTVLMLTWVGVAPATYSISINGSSVTISLTSSTISVGQGFNILAVNQ